MPFTKIDKDKMNSELQKAMQRDEEVTQAISEFDAEYELGMKLVAMRKAQCMTQKELGMRMGLSQRAISRLEKESGGTIKTLLRYLQGMDCSLELTRTK